MKKGTYHTKETKEKIKMKAIGNYNYKNNIPIITLKWH